MIYDTPRKGQKFVYQPSNKSIRPYTVSEIVFFVQETDDGRHQFKRADGTPLILDTFADIFPFVIELPYQEPKMSKSKTYYR